MPTARTNPAPFFEGQKKKGIATADREPRVTSLVGDPDYCEERSPLGRARRAALDRRGIASWEEAHELASSRFEAIKDASLVELRLVLAADEEAYLIARGITREQWFAERKAFAETVPEIVFPPGFELPCVNMSGDLIYGAPRA